MTLFIIIRFIYEAYFRFPHFKILRAGMRRWIYNSSNQFVTYQIELKTKRPSSELIFDDLWIDDKKYKFHLCRDDRKSVCEFLKKEVLKLSIISEIKGEVIPEISKLSKGILLIGYTYKNKKKYLSVKKFKEMDTLKFAG